MEQMCTGVCYFLGPVFVMAKWESSLTPLLVCAPFVPSQDPPKTTYVLGCGSSGWPRPDFTSPPLFAHYVLVDMP